MEVKKQQLEPDMEQWTGSQLERSMSKKKKKRQEYVNAVYCHPADLTYKQNTSCEMLGWMKLKLETRLKGEITITSDVQITPPLWQKGKRN